MGGGSEWLNAGLIFGSSCVTGVAETSGAVVESCRGLLFEARGQMQRYAPSAGDPSVYHPQLSRGQETVLANQRRDCPDDVGGGNTHPRSRPRLESVGTALPQRSMPSSGDGSLSAGEAGAADGRR